MSNYSAIDMATAAAQGFRDGVASVANSAIPNNQDASAAPAQQVEWRTTAVMLEQANAGLAQLNGKLRAELSALKAQQVGQHPDDAAVDRFAAAMKAKLARSREKGRHGWQNCTAPHLSSMLYDHLYKADPLDVGNFAMMLHQNGQAIELPFEARGKRVAPQPAPSQDVAEVLEPGKIVVSAEPLRRVLNALVNAPHRIRELQVTREPVELFADNPINILIAEFEAAHDKQNGGEV